MEKNREITVKGIGNLSAPVDWVIIKLSLAEKNNNYEKGFVIFEQNFGKLQDAIFSVGFDKKELKTTDFHVITTYKGVEKRNEYRQVFDGYRFCNDLKLEFSYDSKKISEVLKAISRSNVSVDIEIQFSVQDKDAVVNQLLFNATQNAKQKAKILCDAMGVKLGKLLTINYDWTEIEIYSSVKYEKEHDILEAPFYDISPDDVHVNEDAVFVWEITD